MDMEEFQALKSELQQLNMELKRFKEELLTTRVEELGRIVHAPARRLYLRIHDIGMSIDEDVN